MAAKTRAHRAAHPASLMTPLLIETTPGSRVTTMDAEEPKVIFSVQAEVYFIKWELTKMS